MGGDSGKVVLVNGVGGGGGGGGGVLDVDGLDIVTGKPASLIPDHAIPPARGQLGKYFDNISGMEI